MVVDYDENPNVIPKNYSDSFKFLGNPNQHGGLLERYVQAALAEEYFSRCFNYVKLYQIN